MIPKSLCYLLYKDLERDATFFWVVVVLLSIKIDLSNFIEKFKKFLILMIIVLFWSISAFVVDFSSLTLLVRRAQAHPHVNSR